MVENGRPKNSKTKMTEKFHIKKSEAMIDELRTDMLSILTVYWAINFMKPKVVSNCDTRFQMVAQLVSIDCAVRELVIRIVALDDEGSGKRSFSAILKLLREEKYSSSRMEHLQKLKKKFRQDINTLKTQHRNKNICHIQIGENTFADYVFEPMLFKTAISSACSFLDSVADTHINYNLKVGSQEPLIDLHDNLD